MYMLPVGCGWSVGGREAFVIRIMAEFCILSSRAMLRLFSTNARRLSAAWLSDVCIVCKFDGELLAWAWPRTTGLLCLSRSEVRFMRLPDTI